MGEREPPPGPTRRDQNFPQSFPACVNFCTLSIAHECPEILTSSRKAPMRVPSASGTPSNSR